VGISHAPSQPPRALARGGWALISCSLGVALVLAQYASLTDRDPHPFNVLAKVIASGGSGLALLSWIWSGIIYYRLRREGYQPHPAAGASGCSFIFFILWLALAVGGVVVMSAGGKRRLHRSASTHRARARVCLHNSGLPGAYPDVGALVHE
jgi:hypothetical protein